MEAKKEIGLLQALKEDTYFAQVFKPEIIDSMCENIRKDFPIDCGVDMFENSTSLLKAKQENKTLKGQLQERENEIEDLHEQRQKMADYLIRHLFESSNPSTDQEIESYLDDHIGRKEIIKRKIKIGINLSSTDQEWLLNNL